MTWKSKENPMFRSQFSESIFKHKYAHEGCETWEKLSDVLVEDVCRDKLSKDEKFELKRIIRELKFIPGGRYLYYAGRPAKFFNNCFSGDTEIFTEEGWSRLDKFEEGEKIKVWSPVEDSFLCATMHSHGRQELFDITFKNVRGKSKKEWKVKATRDHRWLTTKGETTNLQVGDVVPPAVINLGIDDEGWSHGLVFADGQQGYHRIKDGKWTHQLRLCGDKSQYLDTVNYQSYSYPDFAEGDPVCYVVADDDQKKLPDESKHGLEYITSFIRGWVELDGHIGGVKQVHSINKRDIEFFVKYAPLCGMVATGEILCQEGTTNYATEGRKPLWRVNYQYANDFQGFKVASIKYSHVATVYCPYEPKHNRIVLKDGMDTFQCYLLRAEEDSREDWANLSWKAESCLMTGGGIGADYSRYRGKNHDLSKTGGKSSGPIPKMEMLNEQGRRVMQGGSRRSAIYASLVHSHPDIFDFLVAKNWQDMKVKGTKYTLADLKQLDFNFPCPLDMTNVSVNYDTAWIERYKKTGEVGEVFRKNIIQALSTAEPGFSFNFYDKEDETLRNACTEVTSVDDSDVCNLGSVNLGRVEDINEFLQIIELSTKFLLCGTLVADLPYQKVHEVRQKNRRLGLGLMGIHEWLIKRKQPYSVTEELKEWLNYYKTESDSVSRYFANKVGVSVPVANRAIAPTGTIGILAGTSTGIEPIFAVAYKRRYLKGSDKWHYQYVVDAAAQELIELYGTDPEKIESALDLSRDYERRIAFQADVQDYVDMAISSTINLPKWGTKYNNKDTVEDFTKTLAKYAHRLRGFTCYPDGARGGQPLTPVKYSTAVGKLGEEFEEHVETHDICDLTGHGGTCGV